MFVYTILRPAKIL